LARRFALEGDLLVALESGLWLLCGLQDANCASQSAALPPPVSIKSSKLGLAHTTVRSLLDSMKTKSTY